MDGLTAGGWRGIAARFLPTALLLAALAAVFIFAGDRGSFYRSPSHDRNSSKNLALAENLSPAHNFRLFLWRSPGEDGEPVYEMYSRFPVGGPALIKLAIAPFGDDLSARIHAARLLMLAMFAGAAALGYLALARISGSRWIALAAALFAFSSFWLLYHADEISNESVMDIFAAMLVFHGMVAFLEKRRFGQLLAKSCAALLIGWHIYALLLPFIALGFGGEAARAVKSAFAERRRPWRGLARTAARLALSRYLILGFATLLFGVGVLAFNFWNEYTAFNGEIPLAELPSVSSAVTRTGGDDSVYAEYEFKRLEWRRFANEQLYRVGVAVLPYSAPFPRELGQTDYGPLERPAAVSALGLAATLGAAACAVFARRRRLALASLALFGFVWSIPMRHSTAFLEYESVVFVGVPMVLATVALMGARRISFPRLPRFGARTTSAAALAAVGLFVASAFEMSRFERDGDRAAFNQALMADFSAMRPEVQGASVFVPTFLRRYSTFEGRELTYAASYALAGGVLAWEDEPHLRDYAADYAISRYRDEIPALKTPNNAALHLYDGALTNIADLRLLGCPDTEYGPAVACDNFAVHLEADRLTYIKDRCDALDAESRFALSVFPESVDDLPEHFKALGHESMNFEFPQGDLFPGGGCVFQRKLPRYPIDRLELGQWTAGDGPIWAKTVESAGALMAAACPDNEHGTAIACTDYAVYVKGSALTYVNDRCAQEHMEGRFMLSVFPQDPADIHGQDGSLPHQAMNFDFPPDGRTAGGGCLFRVAIPDYPIDYIITGQWIKGEGGFGVWEAWAYGIERRRFAACENPLYGTAIVCENFAVHIDGDTLAYAKDRCDSADAESRFLLSVFPHDANDLPPSDREAGHANMNFDFPADAADSGGGGCVFRRELPKYPIDYIAVGQWSPGGASASGWLREARGIDRLRTLACADARFGAAAACGDRYDIYLSGKTLTMFASECSPESAGARFFLSVFPEDPANVPKDRRERGLNHASMNFDFPRYGVRANGECLITVPLPDYAIAAIETGRADAGAGGAWRAKIAVPE